MVGDRPPPMCWGWGQTGVYLSLTVILALTIILSLATIPFLLNVFCLHNYPGILIFAETCFPMRLCESFLWDLAGGLSAVKEKAGAGISGGDRYVEYSLRALLELHGHSLDRIFLGCSVEEFPLTVGDVYYLGALMGIDGHDVIELLPRYTGSEDDWVRLMDMECEDIIIRFSAGEKKLSPTWVSACIDGEWVQLSGERLDWHSLFVAEREAEDDGSDTYYEPFSLEELYDLNAEAFDPDYDGSDNPYRNWRY